MTDAVLDLLKRHFDTAFAAPEGIKKLRELVLTLAMQGKLVPQNPNDQPAGELLKEIEAEKQKLVKEGELKKAKPLNEIKPDEIPHDLPQGWEWVRLGEVVLSVIGGGTPSKSNPMFWDGNIPWASVKDLNVDVYLENTLDYITEKAVNSSSTNVIPKGHIIVCTRMGLGKIAINTVDTAINQDLKALRLSSYVNQMFFFKKYKNYKIVGSGMTVHGIRQDELLNFLFPLPPISEQQRIVDKIDQLMVLCDKLEKLRGEREEKRVKVHTAAINQLLDVTAERPAALNLEFITQHFSELYSVKENVAALRKAILQLAVMGRLTPQDPNDPPVSELLNEIKVEKQRLVKEGKIKRSRLLPEIKSEEVPFVLPQAWEWERLGNIVSLLGDGIHGTPTYDESGKFFFINGNNLSDGVIVLKENTKKVSFSEYEKHKKELTERTVLVSINGTIGNVAFYNGEPVMLGKSACYFNLFTQIEKQYIKMLINSNYFLEYAFQSATGSTIKNVSLKAMREFCVPLPPLPEQRRIVAKVDQLMDLCEILEQQIDAAISKQSELLNAMMAKV